MTKNVQLHDNELHMLIDGELFVLNTSYLL